MAIDRHLVASGRDWKVAAADGNARISGGGSGNVASVTSGSTAVGIGFGASLPKPVISGDTATYTNVVPGVNLVARATEGGFDLGFVLTSRPNGPLSFNMPLDLHGVTVNRRNRLFWPQPWLARPRELQQHRAHLRVEGSC